MTMYDLEKMPLPLGDEWSFYGWSVMMIQFTFKWFKKKKYVCVEREQEHSKMLKCSKSR